MRSFKVILGMPPKARKLHADLAAPKSLLEHHQRVFQEGFNLVKRFRRQWPSLLLDSERIFLGCSLHDMGKILHPEELWKPGNRHEEAGEILLRNCDVPPEVSRFSVTHRQWWKYQAGLEDLLVSLADVHWKRSRWPELEEFLIQSIAKKTAQPAWQVYLGIEDILQ